MFNYIEKLSDINDFKKLKEQNEKIVFVFSAAWCPDCVMIDKFLEDVINSYKNIKFIYIDRDKFLEIFEALDIFGIPSFVGYVNGNEKSRFVSKFSKTKNEIEKFLNSL